MPTAYLIDASPYIFRAYFALPTTLQSPDGEPANAIYGYTEFLLQILKRASPSHIAVAFDGSLTTSFRNEIYPEYKAQRALPPEELKQQIDSCFQITEALGMPALIDDRYESDDLIGTLARRLLTEDFSVVIVSSDKDFAQLVDKHVTLWDFARDERYDVDKIEQKFGIRPEQMVDYLALVGDSVDNIPGIAGIGPKTARALLKQCDTLEELLGKPDGLDDLPIRAFKSVKEKLQAEAEKAQLSKRLATIVVDVPLDCDLARLQYQGIDVDKLSALLEKYGFQHIQDRVPGWKGSKTS